MKQLTIKCGYGDLKILGNGDYELSLIVPRALRMPLIHGIDEIKSVAGPLEVSISKARKKRSLDANDYCWVMCHKIAEALKITKEEVYRRHIREVGQFAPLPIKNEVVDKFSEVWARKGIGWFVDIVDDSKLPGYKKVFAYYGSSTYDTKEMSVLIDNIVQDCNALNIPLIITDEEVERLKGAWGKSQGKA